MTCCICFAVPPNITEISENQTVIEGGNVTLKCLADGKPTPSITWTRLADNNVAIMTLSDIRRQDAGKYRCTADNGIGSPRIRDVWIVVQCEYCKSKSKNKKTLFHHGSFAQKLKFYNSCSSQKPCN